MPSPAIALRGRLTRTAMPCSAAVLEDGAVQAGAVVLLERGARFQQVHGKLQHAKVMATPSPRFRRREHAGERGELGVVGGPRAGVGGDAVRAEPARRDLAFEPGEGGLQPAVELLAPPLQLSLAALVRVAQEVLRVVEQAHVERLELQAGERAGELVGQELRVHAVPDAFPYLTISGKGRPSASRPCARSRFAPCT